MQLVQSSSDDHLHRLAEVAQLMADGRAKLMASPDRGRIDVVGRLPDWAMETLNQHYNNLVYWWRHSPCVIAVCDTCGEWKISGSRTESRCFRGQKDRRAKLKWGCQGTMKVVEFPWTSKRPNRRRVKIT